MKYSSLGWHRRLVDTIALVVALVKLVLLVKVDRIAKVDLIVKANSNEVELKQSTIEAKSMWNIGWNETRNRTYGETKESKQKVFGSKKIQETLRRLSVNATEAIDRKSGSAGESQNFEPVWVKY